MPAISDTGALRRAARPLAAMLALGTIASCTTLSAAPNAAVRVAATAVPSVAPSTPVQAQWQIMQQNLPGALLSIWGTSATNIYAVGGAPAAGQAPTVLRYDGATWAPLAANAVGDLWWVYGVTSNQVYMSGSNGLILQHTPSTGAFTTQATPRSDVTLFGIWGAAANDIWAVGGDLENKGGPASVLWHFNGTAWSDTPLPAGTEGSTLFKVWGTSTDDVWVCGFDGVILHYNGTAWSRVESGTTRRLLTIHGAGRQVEAVGGFGDAELVEVGAEGGTSFKRVAPPVPALTGVYMTTDQNGVAVGLRGTVIYRTDAGWSPEINKAPTDLDLHGIYVDPTGGLWTVGGRVLSGPLSSGVLMHLPAPAPSASPGASCVATPGIICTIAGDGQAGFNGDGKPLTASAMYWPTDLEFDANGTMYVLDWNNHRIRQVTPQGTFKTVVGTDFVGDGPEGQTDLVAPGAPGTTVNLNHPMDLQFDGTGLMIISTWHNHKMRTWNPQSGLVRVISGRSFGFSGDGGPAFNALLNQPSKIQLDPAGNLFILDMRNQRIRRIANDAPRTITTVAGTGVKGFNGDNAPLATQFSFPTGGNPEPGGALALDAQGRLYVADTENHRIRLIDFGANTVTTVAGTGVKGFGGDNGPATAALLNGPKDIELNPDGSKLYIADTDNERVRYIDLAASTIHTAAGTGTQGFSGDNGPATAARLGRPFGIAFDKAGNLYIIDTYNHRIRVVYK